MRDGWSIERNVVALRALLLLLLLAVGACGSTPATPGGASGHGGPGGRAAGAAGMTGHPGAGGAGGGSASTGVAGAGGVSACVPGVSGPIVVDCGYPTSSGTPLASVVFNESDVLRAIRSVGGALAGTICVFYNDEHALTLGVRQVVVKDSERHAPRPTIRSRRSPPIPAARPSPLDRHEPAGRRSERARRLAAADVAGAVRHRHHRRSHEPRRATGNRGDGRANPNAIFGSWKAAVRTVDKTKTPRRRVIHTPDADPAKNNWTLAGGDPVPSGLKDEGYGAEARWNVALIAGHTYRIQVMVHDGDQNKGAATRARPASSSATAPAARPKARAARSGGSNEPPGNSCPTGYLSCGPGGVVASCPTGTVCANGCCLISVG